MSSIIDESFEFKYKDKLLDHIEKFSFDKFKKYVEKYINNNNRVYNIGIEKN